jgi:hypothetical protein
MACGRHGRRERRLLTGGGDRCYLDRRVRLVPGDQPSRGQRRTRRGSSDVTSSLQASFQGLSYLGDRRVTCGSTGPLVTVVVRPVRPGIPERPSLVAASGASMWVLPSVLGERLPATPSTSGPTGQREPTRPPLAGATVAITRPRAVAEAEGRPGWAGPRCRAGWGVGPQRAEVGGPVAERPRVPPQVVSARYWMKAQRWAIHSEANHKLPPAVTAAL